jgi:hypothetical protein
MTEKNMYQPESMFELDPETYEYDDEYLELGEADLEFDDDEVFTEDELTQLAAELMEAEGLSEENEVFELAEQYVRFAAEAGKNAALAPPGDPRAIASVAAGQAARRLAPGLVSGAGSRARADAARSGRWVRRGNRIILYGV